MRRNEAEKTEKTKRITICLGVDHRKKTLSSSVYSKNSVYTLRVGLMQLVCEERKVTQHIGDLRRRGRTPCHHIPFLRLILQASVVGRPMVRQVSTENGKYIEIEVKRTLRYLVRS